VATEGCLSVPGNNVITNKQRALAISKTIDEYEGGARYTNDPDDAGGETKFGISKRANRGVDIKNLTREDAVAIYTRKYWDKCRCSELPSVLVAWKVFDIATNMGPARARRMLQGAVDAVQDGIIGPNTMRRVRTVPSRTIMDGLVEQQIVRYGRIIHNNPSQVKWINGWLRRGLQRIM